MPGLVESVKENMKLTDSGKIKKLKKKKITTCPEQDQVTVAVEIDKMKPDSDSKLKIDIVSDSHGTDVKVKKKKKEKITDGTADDSIASADGGEKKKKRKSGEVEAKVEKPAKRLKRDKPAELSSPETTPKAKKKKKDKEATSSTPMAMSSPSSTASSLTDSDDKESAPPALTPEEKAGQFSNFNISSSILFKLQARGINRLFPVQYLTLSNCLAGHDIVVKARTGSGKTLAFAIPLVERIQANPNSTYGRAPRALVLSPTRELAKQIGDDFASIATSARATCFYGGTAYGTQFGEIRRGIDILVGTPGRILDHLSKTGPNVLNLSQLEYVVLDEVDRMLDMGFADDVENILKSAYDLEARSDGKKPQTLLFSATVPSWVRNIANKYLETSNLEEVDLVGNQGNQTSTTVDHLAVRCVTTARPGIIDVLLRKYGGVAGRKEARAMVFCQTKAECASLATSPLLTFPRQMLSGDVPQDQRERVMRDFREGRCQCLVATDVAARGLDVPEVDMVIQCSPPGDVDSYIHRSGRTGRAGRRGVCICLYAPNEESKLKQVERAAKVNFTRTPAPKAEELMDLKKDEILESLKEISDEARDVFLDSADTLIESSGAREALATALAALSGIKTCQRSLLTGAENHTTMIITGRAGFRTKGFVYRIIEGRLGAELKERISSLSLSENGDSAVFDLPSEEKEKVLESFNSDHREWIEVCQEIPALQEAQRFGAGRGYGFGRGGGGGGFRQNRGGFNRSFGGRGSFVSRGGAPKRKISF